MSEDVSFDMMQRGGKIRVLSNEMFVEHPRELQGGNVSMTQEQLNKLARDAGDTVAVLKHRMQENMSRIEALERERHGGSSSDLPEFHININRTTGTVEGNPPLDRPPGKKRELSEETDFDLPEYSVHVDRDKGTVGSR